MRKIKGMKSACDFEALKVNLTERLHPCIRSRAWLIWSFCSTIVLALASKIRSSANPLSRRWVDCWRLNTGLSEMFQKPALERPPWGLPFCWVVVMVVFSVWAIMCRLLWKSSDRPNRFLGHLLSWVPGRDMATTCCWKRRQRLMRWLLHVSSQP